MSAASRATRGKKPRSPGSADGPRHRPARCERPRPVAPRPPAVRPAGPSARRPAYRAGCTAYRDISAARSARADGRQLPPCPPAPHRAANRDPWHDNRRCSSHARRVFHRPNAPAWRPRSAGSSSAASATHQRHPPQGRRGTPAAAKSRPSRPAGGPCGGPPGVRAAKARASPRSARTPARAARQASRNGAP